MKKVMLFIFIFFYINAVNISADDKDLFLGNLFKSVYTTLDYLNMDFSRMSGIKSSGAVMKGSASTGNFPSFSVGNSFSVVFLTNPLAFLKNLEIAGNSLYDTISAGGDTNPINWFDSNFIPLPVTVTHFEVGLPKGFLIAGNFTVTSLDVIYNAIPFQSFGVPVIPLKTFLSWGFGIRTGYTIMNSSSYLPCIAANIGFDISEQRFNIEKMSIGKVDIDSNSIETALSLDYLTTIPSITTSLSISKLFIFFEPYFDLRFSQSFYYNATDFTLYLSTDDMDQSTKEFFGDGRINIGNTDDNGYGKIIPVTDFTMSTGFQFNIKGVRLGLGGSYSFVSRLFMASLDIRFQLDNKVLRSKSNKNITINNNKENL